MPRRPRVHSHSNIYHVCLRGINQQQIFYDKEDYRYFLKVLEKYKEPSGYMIHAYCLMGNHIHLLIQTGAESLETVFKRIGLYIGIIRNTNEAGICFRIDFIASRLTMKTIIEWYFAIFYRIRSRLGCAKIYLNTNIVVQWNMYIGRME